MFVLIVDVYGESLCLLMPSVFWNIGGLGEFIQFLSHGLQNTSRTDQP